ncbi:uncharacterized protein LOC122877744 [Siniperca chuatsi]|uniref:uncharacterized protein LOC122877744 n=1 Tax=Siniperca chuatsi TaxID=119488 RepID=UPI001CE0AF85|nr:uncharacterized protein LOC122877744 [Siniperca chuatsi]
MATFICFYNNMSTKTCGTHTIESVSGMRRALYKSIFQDQKAAAERRQSVRLWRQSGGGAAAERPSLAAQRRAERRQSVRLRRHSGGQSGGRAVAERRQSGGGTVAGRPSPAAQRRAERRQSGGRAAAERRRNGGRASVSGGTAEGRAAAERWQSVRLWRQSGSRAAAERRAEVGFDSVQTVKVLLNDSSECKKERNVTVTDEFINKS